MALEVHWAARGFEGREQGFDHWHIFNIGHEVLLTGDPQVLRGP